MAPVRTACISWAGLNVASARPAYAGGSDIGASGKGHVQSQAAIDNIGRNDSFDQYGNLQDAVFPEFLLVGLLSREFILTVMSN